jgi:hypothetical protein
MTTPTTAQRLAAEGIANYAQDLRQLSAEELRALFAFASSGKINATRVIKNLIWQAYTAIRDDRRASIGGNLRSFWYTDVKPVLSRLGVPVEGRRATELVYDAFVELVTRHHLFHYRDLGFLDEGAQTRAVGQTNGTVILFAEKDGRFALVREIAQTYDATALALGGYPSSLATDCGGRLRPLGLLDHARVHRTAPRLRRPGGHAAPPHSSGAPHYRAGRPGPVHAPQGQQDHQLAAGDRGHSRRALRPGSGCLPARGHPRRLCRRSHPVPARVPPTGRALRAAGGNGAPASAVAERIVQMDAAELRELRQRLRERLAPASAEA